MKALDGASEFPEGKEEWADHVENLGDKMGLNRDTYMQAQEDALAEGQPPWLVIKQNLRTCLTIMVVQGYGIILGLEYVLLGALVGVQAFCRTMGDYDSATDSYAVAASTLSLWAGLFGLMQLLGQLFAGWFADRFGRTKCVYLMVFNVYIGVMTEILSSNKNDYTGAKIIMGTATGMMQVVIPTYVAEITPREIRGISIGLFGFNLSLGALVGTFVTWGANQAWGADAFDDRGWKVPLYVGLAAPTIFLIPMLILMPESPYWLILKNRVDEARHSLQKLRPNKSTEEIARIEQEMRYTILKEREEKESYKDASYLECLRGPNLRRTFSAVFPSLSQQLVGNQLVQSYSTYFFTVAKLSNALFGSVIVSCVGLAAAIVAFFLIERKSVGRWPLVFYGVIGITLAMLGIGVIDTVDHGNTTQSAGAGLVAMVAIFNAAVTVGPGVAGWSYTGEAASARLRAKTATLAVGSNAIIGTVTNIVIPFELTAIGPKTGYMFFGIGVIACFLIYMWIPEVSGRSYGQLDELFERRIPARKFKETVCTGDYGNSHQRDGAV
ncbi:general substrate transporter [Xylariales sp. PMI_506]|nr:general substrate transporter [Xylariales sp. PMI_506]